MKKLIMILVLVATSAFAEPSFNQIQDLIGRQQYSAAAQGLEQIIHNHPNSAKAFYSMAQAQAGLGNLDKARYALDKATGLDPTLSFASESQVQSLRDALTPQVKKIEMIEETHYVRNTLIVLLLAGIGYAAFAYYKRRKDDEEEGLAASSKPTPKSPAPDDYASASPSDKAYMREYNLYKPTDGGIKAGEMNVVTASSGVGKSVYAKTETPKPSPAPVATPAPVYSAPAPQPTSHTTVVNNTSNDGFLTGMLVGNMLSSHHHDHEKVIEREVVREVPSKSYESPGVRTSSWDSDASSSSWDSDDSSSKRSSSSWSSSSSSDSSWDSGSSSSSSWDSGSSSSDSSW